MSEAAVLDLKRRALQAKNAGDLDEARRLLAEAKNVPQMTTPLDFKRLAVQLKRNGDIEGAKEALTKAKLLESEQQQQASAQPTSSTQTSQTSQPPPAPRVIEEDPINKAIDEANLEELSGIPKEIDFTDDEMLDVDTMADFASSGMDIPSEDKYKARALACKKAALQAKNQGDIALAKQHLMKAKQFEAATEKLFRIDGGDAGAALEDDGEDYSLLDELLNPTNGSARGDDKFFEDFFGSSADVVELDDLDGLDKDDLNNMIEAGMTIPDVDAVMKIAQEKKARAIAFKKDGNIAAAKGALEESKRLEGQAAKLAELLRAIESDQNMDPDAMFEAALRAVEEPATKPQKATSAAATASKQPVAKEPLKSSQEYRAEAVRLKKENKMSEAVEALRKYKEALVVEASAADAKKRKEWIDALQAEIKVAKEQVRMFPFYERFVDRGIGSKQLAFWKQYEKKCSAGITGANNGKEIPALVRNAEGDAMEIITDDLRFVGETCDPTDTRVEITLMEAIAINDNKHMKKLLEDPKRSNSHDMIRIETTVQLPPSADAPDDDIKFTCNAEANGEGAYAFNDPCFVDAERGSSRFAKLLARRLQRKRVTFDVYYVEIKKGFLSQSSNETLLGTAVLELKHLLSTQFVAGDFPLLDATRRHETGGMLRISMRTGAPFVDAKSSDDKPAVAATGLPKTSAVIRPFPTYDL